MAKNDLNKLEDKKTSVRLLYRSGFDNTQTALFEMARNSTDTTKKTLRMWECLAYMFGFDVNDLTFDNLYAAADFFIKSGGRAPLAIGASVTPLTTHNNPVQNTPVQNIEPVVEPDDDGVKEFEAGFELNLSGMSKEQAQAELAKMMDTIS